MKLLLSKICYNEPMDIEFWFIETFTSRDKIVKQSKLGMTYIKKQLLK